MLTIGTLLPIMNPFSTAPLFLSLTMGCDPRRRHRQALLAALYAFGLLALFLFLGTAIIDFFQISLAGIRVAGGLVISVIGMRMLFPSEGQPSTADGQEQDLEIAFTPIAMPSLAGPGSISVVVTASAQIKSHYAANLVAVYGGVTVGLAVTAFIAFLVLRGAGSLARLLGASGLDAMTRIFGFLLVAIGVQFLLTGIADFFGLRAG